ncbi:MAG: cytochrome c [Vulcanimicrobiota bacterium]
MNLLLLLVLMAGCSSPQPGPSPSSAEDPTLTLQVDQQTTTFTRSQLLVRPDVETITVEDVAGYPEQTMVHLAIPMHKLLDGFDIAPDQTLAYDTLDGFSSSLKAEAVLNSDPSKALAYLAIEPPDKPWPNFGHGRYGAGPYYLVWLHPERSGIGREEWPFKLKAFTVRESVDKQFPGLLPNQDLPQDSPEWMGYRSFVKNCFPCHTLNGQGTAKMGPDLNDPYNPTEYFQPEMLRKLIRDPQSLRRWPQSKMSGFDEKILPEAELDQLLAYLAYMASSGRTD